MRNRVFSASIVAALLLAGCSNSSGGPAQTGGTTSKGGQSSGGSSGGTGGAVGSGGAPSRGGTSASGGKTSAGGAPGSGGASSTIGSGSGGAFSSGGSGSGSASSAGDSGSGGASSTGGPGSGGKSSGSGGTSTSPTTGTGGTAGSTSSGSGGTSAGGSTGAGGGTNAAAVPSAGCSKTSTLTFGTVPNESATATPGGPNLGTGKGGWATITSGGQTRNFAMRLPDNYDNTHPYWLIFAFHGNGETADGMDTGGANGYFTAYWGLQKESKSGAIFVAPEWSGGGWGTGDLAFTDDMVKTISTNYCVDMSNIITSGFGTRTQPPARSTTSRCPART